MKKRRIIKRRKDGVRQRYWVNPKQFKYMPPKAAQKAGEKVLKWKKEGKTKAMTPVGWARARQLARGDAVSWDVVKRMANFNRHRKNAEINPKFKGKPWKDRGYVAWEGWGGDSGVDWARDLVKEAKQKKNYGSYRKDKIKELKKVDERIKDFEKHGLKDDINADLRLDFLKEKKSILESLIDDDLIDEYEKEVEELKKEIYGEPEVKNKKKIKPEKKRKPKFGSKQDFSFPMTTNQTYGRIIDDHYYDD